MNERIIEFIAPKHYVELKHEYPKPIKLNIPEWYKKLEHSVTDFTAKGCMPFLDVLSYGYVLSMPTDLSIKHNVEKLNEQTGKKERDSEYQCPIKSQPPLNINTRDPNSAHPFHPTSQLAGSPLIEKNKHLPFYKIYNPWIIKTPPGFSCLFVPPLNNGDDRFEAVSGIVDTDSYYKEINFPIVINGDKYPHLDTVIKKGTPYVQVIPFRRESWKMKISPQTTEKYHANSLMYPLRLLYSYKLDYWRKKKCN